MCIKFIFVHLAWIVIRAAVIAETFHSYLVWDECVRPSCLTYQMPFLGQKHFAWIFYFKFFFFSQIGDLADLVP